MSTPSQTVNFIPPSAINTILQQLAGISQSLTGINQSLTGINQSIGNLEPVVYNNGFPNPYGIPELSVPAARDMYENIPAGVKTFIQGVVSNLDDTGLCACLIHNFPVDAPQNVARFGAISAAVGFDMASYISGSANPVNTSTGIYNGFSSNVQSSAPIFGDNLRGVASFEMENSPQMRMEACSFNPTGTYQFHAKVGQLLNQLGAAGVYGPQADHGSDIGHGRAEETMGEDSLLCERMMQAKIAGLQSQQVAAVLKHVFEGMQGRTPNLDAKAMRETFIRGYKAMKDSWFIMMGAYNLINGVPQQFSTFVQQLIVRNFFQFNGVIMTDATSTFWSPRLGTLNDEVDFKQILLAHLDAGVDQFLIDFAPPTYSTLSVLVEMLNTNMVSRERLEASAQRILISKYKMGTIPSQSTFIDRTIVDPAATQVAVLADATYKSLVLEQARESIVLCKNDGVLPLNKATNVGYVGPAFTSRSIHMGTWVGDVEVEYWRYGTGAGLTKRNIKDGLDALGASYTQVTPYYTSAQMTGLSTKVYYYTGTEGRFGYEYYINSGLLPKFTYTDSEIQDIVIGVTGVSTVVVSLGWDVPTTHEQTDDQAVFGNNNTGTYLLELLPSFEGVELGFDKQKLLEALLDAGKQVVVVYLGKKVQVIPYRILSRLNAFIYAGELGSYGGQVVAETLYGDNNPRGHLSFSWPSSSACYIQPYHYRLNLGPQFNFLGIVQSTIDYNYSPAFKFAHGLHYGASFTKTNMTASVDENNKVISVSYDFNNVGSTGVTGLATLYGFMIITNEITSRDNSWFLLDFQKVYVEAASTVRVSFTISFQSLAIVPGDIHTQFVKQLLVPAGKYILTADHNSTPNVYQNIRARFNSPTNASYDFSPYLSGSAADATHDFGVQVEILNDVYYNEYSV